MNAWPHTNRIIPVGRAVDMFIANQQNIVLVPNMGNAGDGLINYSMSSLLKKRSIPFTVIEAHNIKIPLKGVTYLIMANGALHHGEHAVDRLIRLLAAHKSKIILASATIQDRDELLRSLPDDAIILAREHVTHEYVCSVRPDLGCVLSEDATMAISDGDAEMPSPGLFFRLLYRIRVMYHTLKLDYPTTFAFFPFQYRNGKRTSTVFVAQRDDGEKLGTDPNPLGNVDLSLVCGGRQTPRHSEASAWILLEIIRAKQSVRTDRLHVAISCCLVGVDCYFSANKYFKCEAVYNHSLARRFPFIHWV